MRYLLRLNAREGSGTQMNRAADGYRTGGKTGTAEKVVDGRYSSTAVLNAFASAFPMDDPQYAMVILVDEPQRENPQSGTTAGWNAGAVVYGDVTTIQWEPDTRDAQNGIDDDKDGLVDEGRVTWRSGTGPSSKSAVLVNNVANRLEGEIGGNNLDDNGNGLVDERGLSFVLEGGRLTVRVTVEKKERDGSVRKETTTSQLRIDD